MTTNENTSPVIMINKLVTKYEGDVIWAIYVCPRSGSKTRAIFGVNYRPDPNWVRQAMVYIIHY